MKHNFLKKLKYPRTFNIIDEEEQNLSLTVDHKAQGMFCNVLADSQNKKILYIRFDEAKNIYKNFRKDFPSAIHFLPLFDAQFQYGNNWYDGLIGELLSDLPQDHVLYRKSRTIFNAFRFKDPTEAVEILTKKIPDYSELWNQIAQFKIWVENYWYGDTYNLEILKHHLKLDANQNVIVIDPIFSYHKYLPSYGIPANLFSYLR